MSMAVLGFLDILAVPRIRAWIVSGGGMGRWIPPILGSAEMRCDGRMEEEGDGGRRRRGKRRRNWR
uniref:Uncharacterized protein n=1 Tax=Arundo donax TaxID=35708 RepID=A0A0A9FDE8_ARUDO